MNKHKQTNKQLKTKQKINLEICSGDDVPRVRAEACVCEASDALVDFTRPLVLCQRPHLWCVCVVFVSSFCTQYTVHTCTILRLYCAHNMYAESGDQCAASITSKHVNEATSSSEFASRMCSRFLSTCRNNIKIRVYYTDTAPWIATCRSATSGSSHRSGC